MANPYKFTKSSNCKGASDIYESLLYVKHQKNSAFHITKAQAKAIGVKWDFIAKSCEILDLDLSNRAGRYGHSIWNMKLAKSA